MPGVAVMSVMAITTLLAALTMSICWDTHPLLYGVFLLVYLPLELTYLSATLAKMASGGWVSPLVAVIVSTIKLTWWWGSSLKAEHTRRNKVGQEELLLLLLVVVVVL
jgi:KUP system potassium uptake protein